MKPKKVKRGHSVDEDVHEFLKTLSANHEASYFINLLIKESKQFKQWDEKREEGK